MRKSRRREFQWQLIHCLSFWLGDAYCLKTCQRVMVPSFFGTDESGWGKMTLKTTEMETMYDLGLLGSMSQVCYGNCPLWTLLKEQGAEKRKTKLDFLPVNLSGKRWLKPSKRSRSRLVTSSPSTSRLARSRCWADLLQGEVPPCSLALGM